MAPVVAPVVAVTQVFAWVSLELHVPLTILSSRLSFAAVVTYLALVVANIFFFYSQQVLVGANARVNKWVLGGAQCIVYK